MFGLYVQTLATPSGGSKEDTVANSNPPSTPVKLLHKAHYILLYFLVYIFKYYSITACFCVFVFVSFILFLSFCEALCNTQKLTWSK